jgi:septum site-determining protein MinC
VSTTLRRANGELWLDLSGEKTFAAIKRSLAVQINTLDDYMLGAFVCLDVGTKQLTNKQVREIEDILLDHGLHLREIMSCPHQSDAAYPDKPVLEGMPEYGETLLLCRNLRSGQKISSNGNVVILGDINPGAEVVARGNILVMGSLRGIAHAGAGGDETAVVAAFRLNPTQIRIANHITRPPDGEVVTDRDPEVARIRDGKVIIDNLKI